MAINIDDAYEVGKNGIAISDDDGNILYYQTAGFGPPFGFDAPLETRYTDTQNNVKYRKVGTGNGVDDWAFDVSKYSLSSADAGELDTSKIIEVYENTGGAAVAQFPAVTPILFDQLRPNADLPNYSFPVLGELQFESAGDYWVDIHAALNRAIGNGWVTAATALQIDTGGGWGFVAGAAAFVSIGAQGTTIIRQGSNSFGAYLPNVNIGDKIRAVNTLFVGTSATETQLGSSMRVRPAEPKVNNTFQIIDAGEFDGNSNHEPALIVDGGEL